MRGATPGLPTTHPIGEVLPAVYLEDDFTQRLTAGLDEVLVPVLLTLDCLDAYLDLDLAPTDFLDWLAGWVAMPVGEMYPAHLRRAMVRAAIDLYRWRGTARGIQAAVALVTDAAVEITDPGGVRVATEAATTGWRAEVGGDDGAVADSTGTAYRASVPQVRVRVHAARPEALDAALIRRFAAMAVPAHVDLLVEVVAL